jgi:hypothetical protein
MARQLSQKKFKLEIEFTVTMNAVEDDASGKNGPDGSNASLEGLQKALAENDVVLAQQMIAAAFVKLQEYTDYIAGQDNVSPLIALSASLEPAEQETLGLTRSDFLDATRQLRTNGLNANVDGSSVVELVPGEGGCPVWRQVWSDLRPGTELGRLMEHFYIPVAPPPDSNENSGHYLQVRYLTDQADGVHVEGRCTCGQNFNGVGADETRALAAAWSSYQKHLALGQIGEQMNQNLHPTFQTSQQ